MKKLVLCLMAAAAMTACKKNTETETTEVKTDSTEVATKAMVTATPPDCENDSVIKAYQNVTEANKAQWLRDNGHLICDRNLYECIEKFHNLETASNFNALVSTHPDNSPKVKYYTKKWSEVNTFISGVNCYEKYLGFTFSGGQMSLKLVDTFTVAETCYSIPFIKSIALKQGLRNSDEFMFAKGMVPRTVGGTTVQEEKVVFSVKKGTALTFFDISDNPIIPL